jgi:hypothetical protein
MNNIRLENAPWRQPVYSLQGSEREDRKKRKITLSLSSLLIAGCSAQSHRSTDPDRNGAAGVQSRHRSNPSMAITGRSSNWMKVSEFVSTITAPIDLSNPGQWLDTFISKL